MPPYSVSIPLHGTAEGVVRSSFHRYRSWIRKNSDGFRITG